MEPMGNAGLFLVELIFSFLIFAFVARMILRFFYVSGYNPVINFIAAFTTPVTRPLMTILPDLGRIDLAALVIAFGLQIANVWVLLLLLGKSFTVVGLMVLASAKLLNTITDILFFAIIIQVILSWVSTPSNPNPLAQLIYQIVEPLLAPFRRLIPMIGGLDLSPIAALAAIKLFEILAIGPLNGLAVQMMFS